MVVRGVVSIQILKKRFELVVSRCTVSKDPAAVFKSSRQAKEESCLVDLKKIDPAGPFYHLWPFAQVPYFAITFDPLDEVKTSKQEAQQSDFNAKESSHIEQKKQLIRRLIRSNNQKNKQLIHQTTNQPAKQATNQTTTIYSIVKKQVHFSTPYVVATH